MIESMYYNTPFHLIDSMSEVPFGLQNQVFVISDEKYKAYKEKQAIEEIAVLEKRITSYEQAIDRLRETVVSIKTEAGLLKPAED